MNCQDTAKLRTPLDAVCQTTDIGCVPIVSGKPQCSPMPDELPIAYDKTTSTLWLFSCESRTWVAMSKFSMDQLQELNLDNINNICNLLNIGVYYNPGTGNIQGTVTLSEFTTKLLECLKLDTNVLAITQGENNTISISIEGLDGLPPFYIKGDNISFTGTGTQTDPLVVHGADPICKWPVASQAQVDAAAAKHLGACLDGENVRVPYPKTPCEYEQKSEEQVAAATEKNLLACVDGQPAKVPYPKFQPPVCESEQLTASQAQAAGDNLQVVACNDGKTVRIPVPGSFFEPEFLCVPSVTSAPTSAPAFGTSPLRAGCNGELWVWLCENDGSGRWEEVRFNMNRLEQLLNPDNVANLCENFRMMGWYSDINSDPCVQEVKFTLEQLGHMLGKCIEFKDYEEIEHEVENEGKTVYDVVIIDNTIYKTQSHCCQVGCAMEGGGGGGWCLRIYPTSNGAIFSGYTQSFIVGTGVVPDYVAQYPRYVKLNITNNYGRTAYLSARLNAKFIRNISAPGNVRVFYIITEDPNVKPWQWAARHMIVDFDGNRENAKIIGVSEFGTLDDIGMPIQTSSSTSNPNMGGPGSWVYKGAAGPVGNYKRLMAPGETVTLYGMYFIYFPQAQSSMQYIHSWIKMDFELFNSFAANCAVVDDTPQWSEDVVNPEEAIENTARRIKALLNAGVITEADIDAEIEKLGLTQFAAEIKARIGELP